MAAGRRLLCTPAPHFPCLWSENRFSHFSLGGMLLSESEFRTSLDVHISLFLMDVSLLVAELVCEVGCFLKVF